MTWDEAVPWTQQPWKLTRILWPAVVAALFPLGLRDLLKRLPHMLRHLQDIDEPDEWLREPDRSRPRQIHDFREALPARARIAS